jgi:tetratricopeptide (TPR) repeat protein
MKETSEEQQNSIRKYLLASLDDEVEMRRIEEKILLDDAFVEQLSIAEDELIDEYLDGTLTETEREQFLRFFLLSPENNEKLRLIENLRKYAAKQPAVYNVKQLSEKKTNWSDWQKLFSSTPIRFAAVAILLFGFIFLIWRVAFYQSDVDRGLAELRIAYREARPIEARTTINSDYVPLMVTRGNTTAVVDEKARRRAEILLSDASERLSDAEAHHALGLLFLVDKKYDKVLEEFNFALKFAPDKANIHNDLGAALFEKAKQAEMDGKSDEASENYSLALKSLNQALEIDNSSLEALFNKALVLQKMQNPNQAQEAWEKYLEKDSASLWANEARKNAELLKQKR